MLAETAIHEDGINLGDSKTITIEGAGSSSTFVQAAATAGTAIDRVFNINAGTITLEDMTIRYGKTTDGGGIRIADNSTVTSLALNNVVLSNNYANSAGAGMAIWDTDPSLSMTNCSVINNINGSGLFLINTSTTLSDCNISNNAAGEAVAGGIKLEGTGTLTITNSTISGNSVTGLGGGIAISDASSLEIIKSTLSGNSSTNIGGAIASLGDGTTVTITNSTISGNTSNVTGGGLRIEGAATINNSTIANNHSDNDGSTEHGGGIYYAGGSKTLTVLNSIIANNYIGNGTGMSDDYYFENGTLSDAGNNIVEYQTFSGSWANSSGFDATTSILYNYDDQGNSRSAWNNNNNTSVSGSLGLSTTLANDGGSNQTLAIAVGSFAISAGSWDDNITTDQRGESRRQSNPTIGAYEHLFTNISWEGNTNADWGTTSNWSPAALPLSTDNITIPPVSKGTPPVISPTSTAGCNNLTINSAGSLTIQSTDAGTGSLIVEGTATGNVTAQRYVDDIPAKGDPKWHYVSSPVADQDLDGDWMTSNSILFNDPAYQLYRFSEDTDYWIYYGYTGSEPESFGDANFVDARGYATTRTNAGTYSFTGEVRTSDVTYAATYTSNKGIGWNLVGNPFTSSLAVTNEAVATDKFLTNATNLSLLDDNYTALYIWDESADYTYGDDDYKVIGNPILGSYTEINQDYIQPGQAFMVKVSSAGNLQFKENMQAHANVNFYKEVKEAWPSVELIVKNDELFNSTAIGFNDNMTSGLDPSYDVGKLKGNPNIALYTRLIEDNGVDFAIQALPTNNTENYIVSVGIDVSETQHLSFIANMIDLDYYNILLEDRSLGVFTDLSKNSYTATVTNSGTGRFYLHFRDISAIDDDVYKLNTIQTYASDNTLYILNPKQKQGIVTIYNLTGQRVATFNLTGHTKQQQTLNMTNMMNVVKIRTNDEVISEKVIF